MNANNNQQKQKFIYCIEIHNIENRTGTQGYLETHTEVKDLATAKELLTKFLFENENIEISIYEIEGGYGDKDV
ncbi:MAG: hypothetical protein QXO57_02645 [Candidatus Aenigmatarchaeota archaeon]